ncbi:WD40-repeat-containing domain protein [Aspergillus alliaceus]|uniref:WD40-repeat-containing domain protein n=1 Tax=Petromyces alliaceus TaxID=209559 RepID=UPI0012A5A057|nr:WD40-repeat-containing domain protein [Aspergillus alliaceus]KAB8234827.1 WD40-repeat-containing domain protein [Aspergillus alliaceus]
MACSAGWRLCLELWGGMIGLFRRCLFQTLLRRPGAGDALGRSTQVFDLADHPYAYIPSSAAPDRPDPPIPIEPTPSYPRSAPAPDSILSSSRSDPSVDNSYTTAGAPGPFHLSSTRRRRRRSTPNSRERTAEGTGSLAGDSTASEAAVSEQRTHPTEGHSPSPKRRRLANMRPDGISSANGPSHVSNGSVASPSHKVGLSHSLNGQAPSASSNGDLYTNGVQKSSANTTSYFGHDREEVTRILIQSLYELGYNGAASLLSKESGYQLESPAVATFRGAVLAGRWGEAERILVQSFYPDGTRRTTSGEGDHPPTKERLVLVENADMNEMLFYLRQQKFLELLETRNLSAALTVLRHELTPLNYDIGRLHALSSLLMCPPEHLHDQAGWNSSINSSRERLLSELSKSISPSVMIPDNRLAMLLDNVKQNQINQCLYHNTASPPSLYSDHMCDRADFPLRAGIELSQHSDEVWYCQFSHDGTKLVTAGRDHSVIIYDTNTFAVLHKLMEHDEGVAHACWSPDDTKIITCSQDKKARVWSVDTGRCLLTINHHRQPVTAAAWAADGESFVTASLDNSSQLCHWSMRGHALHMWQGGFRVQDCAITPDGRRLIAADVEEKIHVYNFLTHEEEYCLALKSKPTSVAVSRDSRHMLVNLSEGQIQLIDIDTTDVIRRFQGQKQGSFVIRSTFGGAAENFVVSGSEDSRVYVWHKENGTLVETLEGHISGCVNAISWNPTNPRLFASAGDDCLVRIWTRERDANPLTTASNRRTTPASGFARTSAIRSTSSF